MAKISIDFDNKKILIKDKITIKEIEELIATIPSFSLKNNS